jgi:hypothetical protein
MPRYEGSLSNRPGKWNRLRVQQAAYVQFSLRSHVDFSVSHSGYSKHHGKTSDVTGRKGCAVVDLVRKVSCVECANNSRVVGRNRRSACIKPAKMSRILTGRLLVLATRACARRLASEFLEEISHTGHKAGLRRRTPVGNKFGRRRNSGSAGRSLRGRRIHVAAKNHRGAHASLAGQKDCFRAGVGRRSGRTCVKAERRHDDGIHGLLRNGWGDCGIRLLPGGRQRVAQGADLPGRRRRSSSRRTRAFHAGSRELAGTR